ncbi:hypothetical protein FQA47_006111 [Oryzias melastigma]|uniref:Uncharacterized protein n=1 Tax=Oryzias melastigma TaxID=30732 RepID=A0A834F4N1_ORYME|nr:hypothetical protein FQA47_006111 [Oryzias melastigma]
MLEAHPLFAAASLKLSSWTETGRSIPGTLRFRFSVRAVAGASCGLERRCGRRSELRRAAAAESELRKVDPS